MRRRTAYAGLLVPQLVDESLLLVAEGVDHESKLVGLSVALLEARFELLDALLELALALLVRRDQLRVLKGARLCRLGCPAVGLVRAEES